jgi:hypothetical protein
MSTTLIVEPDFEMDSDGSEWQLVTPIVHAPGCICHEGNGRLCPDGWVEEYIKSDGLDVLVEELPPVWHIITGYMDSYTTSDSNVGIDHDEWFEVESCVVAP